MNTSSHLMDTRCTRATKNCIGMTIFHIQMIRHLPQRTLITNMSRQILSEIEFLRRG